MPSSTTGNNEKGKMTADFQESDPTCSSRNKTSQAVSTLALVCMAQEKARWNKMFPSYLSDQSLQEATTGVYQHFHIANHSYYTPPRYSNICARNALGNRPQNVQIVCIFIFRFAVQASQSGYWHDSSIVGSILL